MLNVLADVSSRVECTSHEMPRIHKNTLSQLEWMKHIQLCHFNTLQLSTSKPVLRILCNSLLWAEANL
jgi:hypothetical protein